MLRNQTKNKNRLLNRISPAVSGIVVIIALLSACHNEEAVKENTADKSASNKVRLSRQAINLADLEILRVKSRLDRAKISTTGEIKADENRVFHINSIVAGRVTKDNVVLGTEIKRGDELAVVENLDVARIYGEYVHQAHQNEIDIAQSEARLDLAKKNAQRLEKLNKEGIVAEKDLLTAQSQQRLCEITLKGFKEHIVHIKAESRSLLAAYGISLDKEEKYGLEHISSGSPIVSPKDGVVIKKNVTVGDVVTPIEPLYVVADLSQVWLDIAVYDKDLEKIKVNESLIFHSDSIPGLELKGTISYIQPVAGDTAKTFLARAILPNPKLLLKPGMFGQVEIIGSSDKYYPYVPDRALQKYGDDIFVFVQQKDGSFEKRKVIEGDRLDDGYLVTDGVAAGERIVGSGSFKLKSELLKSEIGNDD